MEGTTESAGTGSSPTDVAALFKKFDDYPWAKDRQFLQGLAAMLGPLLPSADMQKAAGISVQARIWWFQGRLGVQVDPAAYEAYRSENPDAPRPDRAILAKIEDIQRRLGVTASGAATSVPSWQAHAPKADLRVKATDGRAARDDDNGAAAAEYEGQGQGQDAPYPERFRAVIEAVTTGKPVPGIKEIPNTVVRQPGISPVGKMQPPKKPWERQQDANSQESSSTEPPAGEGVDNVSDRLPPSFLDQAFPPVTAGDAAGDGGENGQEPDVSAARA